MATRALRQAAPKLETYQHIWQGRVFEIQVDQWGSYWISEGGKSLRTVGSGEAAFRPYGSKALRATGLAAARAEIEGGRLG